MKKAFCFLLCFIIGISFSSCDLFDRVDKEDIFSFVKENKDKLLQCIEENDFSYVKQSSIIKKIDTDYGEYDFVDFYCGCAGFGPETSYWGFYYSEDDDLTKLWCAPGSSGLLKKSGDGYLWEQSWYEAGDNTYYTENICGHFYYYEASY